MEYIIIDDRVNINSRDWSIKILVIVKNGYINKGIYDN